MSTRFSRIKKDILPSENIDPPLKPPWETPLRLNCSLVSTLLDLKVPHNSRNDSKAPDGRVGIRFVHFQMDFHIYSGAPSLGMHIEIQDAEAHAVLHGIKAATGISTNRFPNNMRIFLDDREVLRNLTKTNIRKPQIVYN